MRLHHPLSPQRRLVVPLSQRRVVPTITTVSTKMTTANDCSFLGVGNTPPNGGTHQKSASLVGFDPFLPDSLADAPDPPSQNKRNSTPAITTPVPPQVEQREGIDQREDLEKMQKELRAIATQLERESPRRNISPERKPEQHSSLSPPQRRSFRNNNKTTGPNPSPAAGNRNPFSPFAKKRGHRKTQSLTQWKDTQEKEGLARPATVQTRSVTLPTPLSPDSKPLHEVWAGMKDSNKSPTAVATKTDGIESLFIPSLAKPRPTSLLTGENVVRSSEFDATAWQLEIPEKKEFQVATKMAQFLDTYHSNECLLDLSSLVGYTRLELAQFASGAKPCSVTGIADCHRKVVESLLDCGEDIVEVHGYWHSSAQDLDQRREVLILERQRQFLVVLRGTTAEQQGKYNRQPETVALKDGRNVTVFADRFRALQEFEQAVFARLDVLTEATPFCDVVFCGHSYGASMATLAAYLYAYTRGDQRVAALVTASPKVGLTDFRWSVHACANLKVMRLELSGGTNQRGPGAQQARHVGHTLRIANKQIKAYKFSDGPVDSPVRRTRLFKRERDLSDYVQALEELPVWVKGYYKEDGDGVRGKDNEARQMV